MKPQSIAHDYAPRRIIRVGLENLPEPNPIRGSVSDLAEFVDDITPKHILRIKRAGRRMEMLVRKGRRF
jgi:hypothetical protein